MKRSRLGLCAFALVVAACGGAGDGETVASSELTTTTVAPVTDFTQPESTQPAPTQAESTQPGATTATSTAVTTTTPVATTSVVSEPEFDVVLAISIEGGVVSVEADDIDAGDRVDASEGDRIQLSVLADVEDEVHVHGYDIFANTQPGQAVTIEFTADLPGIWEVELERSGVLLVELAVNP